MSLATPKQDGLCGASIEHDGVGDCCLAEVRTCETRRNDREPGCGDQGPRR